MGDWAKGEFKNAGKEPGKDFVCSRFPTTQGDVVFNSDMFAMFKVGQDRQKAQFALAQATESISFQSSIEISPTTTFETEGAQFVGKLQNWLPRFVLAPSFTVILDSDRAVWRMRAFSATYG
jgi:ABC-type glycerol-3-phosphate transport system substrate-binding protein